MRTLAPVAITLLALSGTARAGNDDELLAGNQAAMMGGAVSALVADSSAIWYDPAGLGAITRDQVDVSGTVYTLRFYSVADFITSRGGKSDDASVSEFVSIPTQIAYVRLLAPGLTLGLGYFVPQSTNLLLREQLVITEPPEESAWQVGIASASTLHNAAAALGFALSPRARFGASLIGSYQAQSQSVVVFSAVGPPEGRATLLSLTSLGSGSRVGFELGAGLQLDLSSRLALALTARSPRLQVYRSTHSIMSQGAGGVDETGAGMLAGETLHPEESSTRLALLRAGRYGVSLAYAYARDSRLCLEGDVQPALRVDSQDVRRKLVLNARLGVYHALTPGLALGAGLFTDRSPDVIDGEPGNGAGDFYGATLGLEVSSEHWLAAKEHTDSLIFSSVFALRYAFSRGELSRFVADPEAPLDVLAVSMPGTLIAHEIGLYVGSGLKF